MFVEVLRRYMEELQPEEGGWLSGLRDPFVGQVLRRFHADPGHDWTLESLSREVTLSRSALAERFARSVGQPPMRYLTSLRMQRATELLRETDIPVSAVADRVGYRSDVAFHRAFRRIVGLPPATWRRRNNSSDRPVT
jgi:transcriptional regulator GlxA family with amidase domain